MLTLWGKGGYGGSPNAEAGKMYQQFYTYLYNHAHRRRLENLLYLGLSRSSNGFCLVLLDPGGGFRSQ